MHERRWQYKDSASHPVSPALIASAGDMPLLAKLLAIRGITEPSEAQAFLDLESYQPTSPQAFPDMEKAVMRLRQAIEAKEHILVYGDFDVDGITGTSVLTQCLQMLDANMSYYIPDRHQEGHGLNTTSLIRLVSSRKVKVVITTDTGITNFNEVSLLNGLKVDTIITDHHELPENLPQAFATLNPKLLEASSPLAYLAGVGVAYKLSQALLSEFEMPESAADGLLDLVALGTVVDMVPLLRENRYLVWRGIQLMQRRERLGIKALLDEATVPDTAPINTQTLGFTLGPRLNALGRLANAAEAVELLTTTDVPTSQQLAAKLEQMNRQRRELVDQTFLEAEKHLMSSGELSDERAIILASKSWNPGVVGLVATRLIEKHHRPCFMGYIDDETQEVRFSARSIEGFDLHHHLTSLEDMFIRWGGHSGAAGFSIAQSDLQKLKTRLFALCQAEITDEQMRPITWMDLKLSPSQVNPYLVDLLEKMAPFGQGNPLPIFGLESMAIGAQRRMGDDNRHLKLVLTTDEPGRYLEAIHWNWGKSDLNPKNTYKLAFTAELNTFNGTSKVQLLIKDLQDESRPSAVAIQSVASSQVTVKTFASANSKPSASALPPTAAEQPTVVASSASPQWIDHRGRDDIEGFLSQMLVQTSPEKPMYAIFCEGTQLFFPLPLPDEVFCTRNGQAPVQPAKNLLLWDLPADLVSFQRLMETQQPHFVHLIGGKYRKMPLYRPPQEVLEGFAKVLLSLWKKQPDTPITISLSELAKMLSTSEQVILSGLSCLDYRGFVSAAINDDDQRQVTLTRLNFTETLSTEALTESIHFKAFQHALKSVYSFREWLTSAPIRSISQAITASQLITPHIVQDERTLYAVGHS